MKSDKLLVWTWRGKPVEELSCEESIDAYNFLALKRKEYLSNDRIKAEAMSRWSLSELQEINRKRRANGDYDLRI